MIFCVVASSRSIWAEIVGSSILSLSRFISDSARSRSAISASISGFPVDFRSGFTGSVGCSGSGSVLVLTGSGLCLGLDRFRLRRGPGAVGPDRFGHKEYDDRDRRRRENVAQGVEPAEHGPQQHTAATA